MSTSPITTHVLDTARGCPASNVAISLSLKDGESWREIAAGKTNKDGRLSGLLAPEHSLLAGTYKMYFQTESYFVSVGAPVFYPYVEVVFHISEPESHYHIPLLLSPFGYSTYRGS